ncbi:MAG: hypothetical protein EBT08_21150, partial [Betaproteobacteria bacterium]|nr:hypothetical protein [Betaproteobacteria bacterium]
ILCMDDVYGGTNRLLNRVRKRSMGLKVEFVDMTDLGKLEAAIKAHKPRMIWVRAQGLAMQLRRPQSWMVPGARWPADSAFRRWA